MHLISPRTGMTVMVGLVAIALPITGCQPRADQAAQNTPNQPAISPASSNAPLSAPPPPPAGAYLGKVSPAVSKALQGLPVLAPAYIPEKFTLAEHRADLPGTYALIYRSPDQCFAIEYLAPDQVPAEPETIPDGEAASFDSPISGPGKQLYSSKAASGGDLVSEWLVNQQGRYRLIGASRITQNYPNQTPCQDVSLTEAVEIVSSLVDLTAPTDLPGDY